MKNISEFRLISVLVLLVISTTFTGQNVRIDIAWNDKIDTDKSSNSNTNGLWFEGAHQSEMSPLLPEFGLKIPLSKQYNSAEVTLRNPIFEEIVAPSVLNAIALGADPTISVRVDRLKSNALAEIRIFPFIRTEGGIVKRLLSAEIDVKPRIRSSAKSSHSFVENSKLSSGSWYRIPISKDGVHKLTRGYFESLGVDLQSIDPNSINVYGNDAGMLPFNNAEFRHDDLQVKAIDFVGGNDGSFDSNDYVLFYAKGPHRWAYSENDVEFRHTNHLFMDVAYCWIGIGIEDPVRIGAADIVDASAEVIVNSFDDYSFHEEDLVNVIKSGRRMVGEQFGLDGSLTYTGSDFNFENIDTGSDVKIRLRGVARTVGSSSFSQMSYSSQNNTESFSLQGTSPTSYTITRSKERVLSFLPTSGNLSVSASFTPGGTDADGWVDYISINVRRQLRKTNTQVIFRDIESVSEGQVAEFRISNMNSDQVVWDVTEPRTPKRVLFDLQGDEAIYKAEVSELKEYALFNTSNTITPGSGLAVANQNLHGSPQYDMLVVSATPFMATAEKVAQIHRDEGLSVLVVEPQIIYNEFSCGMQDITGVKMFMKMFYDRGDNDPESYPDYLLLIGDGNFDNSNINPASSIYLPTYQSAESNSLTQSFVSDDYFGLLDDDEGELGGTVDIGIGRFPVRTTAEAEGIYNKIVRYIADNTGVINGVCNEEASTVFGDWRNKVLLIGDDEDNNIHMSQANSLGNILESVDEDYVIEKVFLDAYLQETTPGGDRYPQASDDLRRAIENGVFLASYTGHGGEVGWAAERILDVPTIQNFGNSNKLPLLLTATCEFSRFDDPGRTSAGEFILLNPDGGVIALLTTTRLVYANPNFILSQNFFDVVMRSEAGSYTCGSAGGSFSMDLPNGLRLGDIIRISKNCTVGNAVNKANFSLLGDPALKMTYPALDIVTDSITDVAGNPIDSLKALQRVKVYGHVEDGGALASGFNGQVSPSVYDKSVNIETLSNDGGLAYSFDLRKNIMYKGRSTVANGQFEFEFIVPKDISYQLGTGKIYLYALSDNTDAQGSKGGFQVGGTDASAPADDIGPVVELFLDSESFVDGGLTNESPTMMANIFDQNGVNTVGNGIGHDITVVLDGKTADPIILNDYYESDLDSYQSGKVRYDLRNLSEGEHTLRFKIWDIYNNSSTKEVSFTVEKREDLVLENVLNYPNPFTTRTEFLFEHNQSCDVLEVQIQVFTVSGRLVKTINSIVDTHFGVKDQLTWDGKDDYGDRLGRGVYVYRLKVSTPEGQKEEVFEKLVLL